MSIDIFHEKLIIFMTFSNFNNRRTHHRTLYTPIVLTEIIIFTKSLSGRVKALLILLVSSKCNIIQYVGT